MLTKIPLPDDFDFAACVNAHGWPELLPFQWEKNVGVLERVEELTPGQPSVLRLSATRTELSVDSEDGAPTCELITRVTRMLQLDIDISEFLAFCSESPELEHIRALRYGRVLRSPTLFEDVLKAVATTNTTWAQTILMVRRLVENFGTPSPIAPARNSFPRPDQIVAVPFEQFALLAKMGYRNASVYRIATEVTTGTLDLESWNATSLSSDEVYKNLLTLQGIGPYAASTLMIFLGHYDRVPSDSWARTLVGYELGRPVNDKDVHDFFEPYGKWKGLVYRFYAWKRHGDVTPAAT